jgi:hypothetical protein
MHEGVRVHIHMTAPFVGQYKGTQRKATAAAATETSRNMQGRKA